MRATGIQKVSGEYNVRLVLPLKDEKRVEE
jgi:hypothetical protein